MKKHIPLDSTIKDLDDMMSRVNGLEVSSTDEYQKAVTCVLKTGQIYRRELNQNLNQNLSQTNYYFLF